MVLQERQRCVTVLGERAWLHVHRSRRPDVVDHLARRQDEAECVAERLGRVRVHRHAHEVIVRPDGEIVRHDLVGDRVLHAVGPGGVRLDRAQRAQECRDVPRKQLAAYCPFAIVARQVGDGRNEGASRQRASGAAGNVRRHRRRQGHLAFDELIIVSHPLQHGFPAIVRRTAREHRLHVAIHVADHRRVQDAVLGIRVEQKLNLRRPVSHERAQRILGERQRLREVQDHSLRRTPGTAGVGDHLLAVQHDLAVVVGERDQPVAWIAAQPRHELVPVCRGKVVVGIEKGNALQPVGKLGLSLDDTEHERTAAAVAGQRDRGPVHRPDRCAQLLDDRDDARVGAFVSKFGAPRRPALGVSLEIDDDGLRQSSRPQGSRLGSDMLDIVAPTDAIAGASPHRLGR